MSVTPVMRPLRFGILGTAKIATKVSAAIRRANGAELVAIASRDKNRAEEWIFRHPSIESASVNPPAGTSSAAHRIKAYGSYQELLDAPDIDAVYIPLPPALHCEWTTRAAERGKHVLCEKPLALNRAEAQTMADACRAQSVQLMDGVMWVHHDRTAGIRTVLGSGELGRLRRVTSAFSFHAKDFQPDNIRFQRSLGGGVLGDLGWYCIRATLFAFGDLPEKVYATARFEHDVDMNLSAILWFAGDRMASFDCAFDTTTRKWFEISGSEGSLICDDFVHPWNVEQARFWVHGAQGKMSQQVFPDCHHDVRMVERFCEVVRSGRLEPTWVDDALATQQVCDAVARSARAGDVCGV